MTAITQDRLAIQTHRIFVRATAEEVWDALTRPGWTQKYGFRAAVHYDMRPGGIYLAFASAPMRMRGASDVIIDGEVLAVDPRTGSSRPGTCCSTTRPRPRRTPG